MSAPPAESPTVEPTADRPPIALLDDEARALVRIAVHLGVEHETQLDPNRPAPVRVSVLSLLAATLFASDATSTWFRTELDAEAIGELCAVGRRDPASVGSALDDVPAHDDADVVAFAGETWSRTMLGVARAAADRARACGRERLAPRDLIGAALHDRGAQSKIRLPQEGLHERFLGHIAFDCPSELDVWAPRDAPATLVLPHAATGALSARTRSAFDHAQRLAAGNRRIVDADHLLVALLLSVEGDDAIGPRLLRELAVDKLDDEALPRLLTATKGAPAPPWSLPGRIVVDREVIEWLGMAIAFDRVMRRPAHRVSRNHLVAVALGRGASPAFHGHIDTLLLALGVTRDAVAERFYEEVAQTLSSSRDDVAVLDVWSKRLRGKPVLASEVERATIVADVAPADDRLDFSLEARSFALLASSAEVAPPLSIGLFGDWGSGKSFFMQLMRKEVETLGAGGGTVQIEFNAWHYAAGDVYASLAHRLFSELKRAFDPVKEKAEHESVEALLGKLQWSIQERAATASALQQAVTVRDAAKASRDAEVRRVEDQRANVQKASRAVLDVAFDQLGDELAAKVLGTIEQALPGELGPEERSALLGALSGTTYRNAYAEVQRVAAKVRTAPLPATLKWIAFCALGAFGAWVLPQFVDFAHERLVQAGGVITGILAAWRTASAYVQRARAIADAIPAGVAAIDTRVQELKKAGDERLSAAEDALRKATSNADDKAAELAEREAEVAALRIAVDGTRPERQLQRLVDRRIEEGTYSKHLGIIETLRDDFEKLSLLLQRTPDDTKRKQVLRDLGLGEEQKLPDIRRIVLYVDDLDRCPADKVADVLQAVHLFLAFPLFVVVVAVDARWAAKSLIQTHPQLALGAASPADYLEKIFQIPFWVAPMKRYGAKRILNDLWGGRPDASTAPAAAATETPAVPPGAAPVTTNEPSAVNPAASHGATEKRAEPQPAGARPGASASGTRAEAATGDAARPADVAPASVADLRKRHEIAGHERLFVDEKLALHLGTSPRRLKRFANLYRLVKASMAPTKWDTFGRDDEEAVLTMLALLTGAPNLAPEILADVRNHRLNGGVVPAVSRPRSEGFDDEELVRARELVRVLPPGAAPVRWAEEIARYAFRRDAVPYRAAAPAGVQGPPPPGSAPTP
jgi:hypothetical protein